jgi:hypothetical protein
MSNNGMQDNYFGSPAKLVASIRASKQQTGAQASEQGDQKSLLKNSPKCCPKHFL